VTGRIRRFHRRTSEKLKRQMKATLLQQVESHLLKVSLVKLHKELKTRDLEARIVATIHDCIWVESPLDEGAAVRGVMEEVMTSAIEFSVPLGVAFEE